MTIESPSRGSTKVFYRLTRRASFSGAASDIKTCSAAAAGLNIATGWAARTLLLRSTTIKKTRRPAMRPSHQEIVPSKTDHYGNPNRRLTVTSLHLGWFQADNRVRRATHVAHASKRKGGP